MTLCIEPCETENLEIYKHFGFNEFIKSAKESYPDGATVDVDYYGMKLWRRSICISSVLLRKVLPIRLRLRI